MDKVENCFDERRMSEACATLKREEVKVKLVELGQLMTAFRYTFDTELSSWCHNKLVSLFLYISIIGKVLMQVLTVFRFTFDTVSVRC